MNYAGTARFVRGRLWFGWVVGFLVWVCWVASVVLGDGLRDAVGNVIGADHLAFYTPARLVLDGRPERMYDFNFTAQYQDELLDGRWGSLEAYRNPPFYCLLYLPTAATMDYIPSMWVWTGVSFSALILGLVLLRAARPRVAFLWSLTLFPVFATISFGQNTLLSFAIFAGVYRLLDGNRPFLAGLVAGLLWYKPQLLVGIFIWWGLMPRTHWKAWLGLGVTGMSLAGVSWVVLPTASQAFVDTLRENMKYNAFSQWNVHNPKAFFAQLLPDYPDVVWPLAAACSLAGVAVAWWLIRRTGGPLRVMFPVAVYLSLWASPHTLIYEWALAIAAAVVLWERFPERRDAWLTLFALAWGVLGFSTILSQIQTEGLSVNTQLVQLRVPGGLPFVFQVSVPVLGVVGWLAARELGRTGRDQSVTTNGHPAPVSDVPAHEPPPQLSV